VLDDFTLYWVTNSATSAGRLYGRTWAVAFFLPPRRRPRRSRCRWPSRYFRRTSIAPRKPGPGGAYRNLISFHEVDRGGHFAAWEQPDLFAAELRAAFRSLRDEHRSLGGKPLVTPIQ
jgi:pimeloyl-ACP methyl ester carboxylesterase